MPVPEKYLKRIYEQVKKERPLKVCLIHHIRLIESMEGNLSCVKCIEEKLIEVGF